MSRCFPFPPPGYEKKPTIDDIDLLKKEKHKEKHHKKDKKDREKREGKEKKEKSDGKHKEKKDKKDKHRDKKKDKEKGKKNYSDEKRVDEQFDSHNGQMLHHKIEQTKQKDGSSGPKKSSVQFRNGEHREQQLLRKEESRKANCSSSDDKKSPAQLWGQNEELLFRNRIKAEDIDNSKFVQELGRRIRDEEKGTSSLQFPVECRKASVDRGEIPKMDGQKITNEATFGRMVMVQNMIDGTMPPLDKWVEDKQKMREKENDDKRGDKRKNKDRDKQRQGKDKGRDKDRTKEEKVKKKTELTKAERDKNKHMTNSDTVGSLPDIGIQRAGGELKKRKDMEINGFSDENEPRPNKMARSTSSIVTENGRKQDFVLNPGSSLSGKQGPSMGSFNVNSKERRVNGIIPSQPMTPVSKKPPIETANHILHKPTTTRLPPVSTDHVATQPLSVPITKPPSLVPNHIATQPLPMPLTKPLSTVTNQNLARSLPVSSTKPSPVVANKVSAQPFPSSKKKPPAEASIRPPHPDTKYLKQILTVPKLEPWSGLDDHEWWLYSSKDALGCKKTIRDDTLQDNKELEVWSEAKHLESVDVCALPYVVPY